MRRWVFTAVTVGALIALAAMMGLDAQMVTGKVKSPLKVGIDYTMKAATAPTVVTSGTFNITCSSAKTYNVCVAYVNEAGVTTLTNCTSHTPTVNQRKLTVTRTDTAPSNSKGWLVYFQVNGVGSFFLEDDATTNPATLEQGFNSNASTSLSFFCSETSMTYASAPQAGPRDHFDANKISTGLIAIPTFAGGNINLITEDTRRFDLATGNVPRFSTDSGANFANLLTMTTKLVTICASGCNYTSLNSACATETSTAANPITYWVGPGTYTTQTSCSGEDHAAFIGMGRGVTTIDVAGLTGDNGAFQPGTSTNWILSDMTIKGHRQIYMAGTGTGGGRIVMRDLELIGANDTTDEDCFFGKGFAAGTTIDYDRNDCFVRGDGFTIKDDGANLAAVRGKDNRFYWLPTGSGSNVGGNAWAFFSSPAIVDVEGDSIETSSGLPAHGFMYFAHDSAGASAARVNVRSVYSRLASTSANGTNASVIFLAVAAAATEVTQINLFGVDHAGSSSDATTSNVFGVNVSNSTTVVNVYGGRWRETGGAVNNTDFKSTSNKIYLFNPDYQSLALTGVATLGGLNGREPTDMVPGGTTACTTLGPVGAIRPDNGGANEEFCWCGVDGNWRCVTATTINGPTN